MRQQLIKWLIEDVIPDAQHSKNAQASILKFANARNLAPAQVEALGQLFNTAKTLSHLEKSASRGASFPILDVPEMVAKYLEMPASTYTETVGEKSAELSLPECLAGWRTLGSEQEIKIASEDANDPSTFGAERRARSKRREQNVAKADIESIKQAKFDCQEEGRSIMESIHRQLRSDRDLDFANIETDALSLHGSTVVPVMDKLANYMAGSKWRVTRGKSNDEKRLIPDYAGVMDKIASLIDLHFMVQASDEAIKAAMQAQLSGPETATEGGAGEQSQNRPSPTPTAGKDDSESKDKKKDNPVTAGKSKSKTPSAPEGSFFSPVNKFMDAGASKGYGLLEPVIQSALSGKNNKLQRTIDTDYTDARHLATLQKLMTTDEVLAEADPDKVVSVYNTLREIAPHLAGDSNVMRVALRSAIQHDGISPFDIKSFLDTTSARQKVDYNKRLDDSINYRGGEMGNRPA